MHSYYDVGVAMVDCVIVISVYTLHVWGPLPVEVQLLIVRWVTKRRQQNNLLLCSYARLKSCDSHSLAKHRRK